MPEQDKLNHDPQKIEELKGKLDQVRQDLLDNPELQELGRLFDRILLPGSSPEATSLRTKVGKFLQSVDAEKKKLISETLVNFKFDLDGVDEKFAQNENTQNSLVDQYLQNLTGGNSPTGTGN